MFRIRAERRALPDSVGEANVADGFIHLCLQGALMFGSDRLIPVSSRPVVRIKQHGRRHVVLPCTTKGTADSPDFFALNEKDRVMWVDPVRSGTDSKAHWRYEVVPPEALLTKKIGFMPQPARIELLQWLKSRY